jgi:hypothetical protein
MYKHSKYSFIYVFHGMDKHSLWVKPPDRAGLLGKRMCADDQSGPLTYPPASRGQHKPHPDRAPLGTRKKLGETLLKVP